MIIREAQFPSDLPYLRAALGYAALGVREPVLENMPVDERYPTYRAALERREGIFFVAQEGLEYAGAAWCCQYTADKPGYAYVDDQTPEITIAVSPFFRGQGVGRLLLSTLIATARDHGVPALSLDVELNNQPAIRLYESLGFQVLGRSSEVSQSMILRLGEPPISAS
jgi:ribosomal protein S18 acetylase RimI-like enzyme